VRFDVELPRVEPCLYVREAPSDSASHVDHIGINETLGLKLQRLTEEDASRNVDEAPETHPPVHSRDLPLVHRGLNEGFQDAIEA
jgi:hypothetical protein